MDNVQRQICYLEGKVDALWELHKILEESADPQGAHEAAMALAFYTTKLAALENK